MTAKIRDKGTSTKPTKKMKNISSFVQQLKFVDPKLLAPFTGRIGIIGLFDSGYPDDPGLKNSAAPAAWSGWGGVWQFQKCNFLPRFTDKKDKFAGAMRFFENNNISIGFGPIIFANADEAIAWLEKPDGLKFSAACNYQTVMVAVW